MGEALTVSRNSQSSLKARLARRAVEEASVIAYDGLVGRPFNHTRRRLGSASLRLMDFALGAPAESTRLAGQVIKETAKAPAALAASAAFNGLAFAIGLVPPANRALDRLVHRSERSTLEIPRHQPERPVIPNDSQLVSPSALVLQP